MRTLIVALCVVAVTMVAGGQLASADKKEEKAKHSIKDVMKTCMKGGLCKKVASGQGDEADAKKLLEMFRALAANKPPKGDADSWKAKTSALVAAAELAVAGDAGAGDALKKAANCGGCHKAHKGK